MRIAYLPLLTVLTVIATSFTANAQIVVCTTSILADFAEHILPENFTIEYIVHAGVCPAHFDVKPSDISLISQASIIISSGISPWLEDVIEATGNKNCTHIDCSGLGPWNTPAGAIKYLNKIAQELADAFPEYKNVILSNLENYSAEINYTGEQLKQIFASRGYVGRKVVCMLWQKSFAEWLDLNVTCTFKPPEKMSIAERINLTEVAKKQGVCAVIDNLQSGTELGSKLAEELGVSHIILTNFPGAIPGTSTYLDMLRYNVNETIKGIALYDIKKGEIMDLEEKLRRVENERNAAITASAIFAISMILTLIMYRRK